MRRFQKGETVGLWSFNKDWEGVDTSPDNGVKITLLDPGGNYAKDADGADINEVSMGAPVASGKFVYYYLSKSTDAAGWWRFRCKGQDGTGDEAKYVITDGGFELN